MGKRILMTKSEIRNIIAEEMIREILGFNLGKIAQKGSDLGKKAVSWIKKKIPSKTRKALGVTGNWAKRTLFNVIARKGKSKKVTDVLPLDGGTVGIAHFAAGGLNSLYSAMGDSLTQKYFGRSVAQMRKINCRANIPSGKNDDGTGCYSKGWWRSGMKKFVSSPDAERVQVDAWMKSKAGAASNAAKAKGWNTDRMFAIAAGISNSLGVGGFKKLAASVGWDAEKALNKYANMSAHKMRRKVALDSEFPSNVAESVTTNDRILKSIIKEMIRNERHS